MIRLVCRALADTKLGSSESMHLFLAEEQASYE
jgi:hypothetical protein